MRVKYFACGLCIVSGAGSAMVQAAPADEAVKPKTEAKVEAKNENTAPKPDAVAVGEIRLDGKITAMTAVDSFEISAVSFTTPAGKVVEFEEPRRKVITFDDALRISPRDEPERMLPRKEMKLGSRIAVIGRDSGSGKPLKARLVLLTDVSSRYTTGRSESISAPVAGILRQGRELFNGRDYERAARAFEQAVRMGEQMNDARGQALSLSWLSNAYGELNQPQKALEASNRLLKIREALNDSHGIAMALNNRAMTYSKAGEIPLALKDLQRAATLINGEISQPQEQVLVLRNLARLYAASKQMPLALEAMGRVLTLVRAGGDAGAEAAVLIALAVFAWEADKAEQAATHFKAAQAIYEKLPAGTPRSETLARIGSYYLTTGDKAKAREAWTQALAEFDQLGDSANAAQTRRAIESLDKPDTEPPATPAAPTAPAPPPAP